MRLGQRLYRGEKAGIAGGKAAELYDYLGSSLVAAIPMAAAAVYSGGTSAVATPASLQAQAAGALSPGLTQTARDVVSGVTKDPRYWLSLFQTVGNNYENAIADMEAMNTNAQRNGGNAMDGNSIRTKAALQAAGSGLMDAGIEVGGGLQTLPKELRQGGNAWKALANSGIGEGKEEVFQGIVDRASQNLVYNKGNPLISLTDPNAVFSLPAAANEFTEGFAIGSILGGGQAGALSAAQAIQSSPITSYAEAFRRLIGMKTEGTATSELTRYQELERKYLDGSISPDEADELWRLERMKGQSITPEEANELWRQESVGKQPKLFARYEKNEYNDVTQWEDSEYLRRVSFVENAPCLTTPKKFTGYFLNPEAKHAEDFFNVGYTKEDSMRLRYDIAK